MGIADQLREKAQQLQDRARQAMSNKGTKDRQEGGQGHGQGDMSQRGKDMRGSALDEDRDR